MKRHSNKKVILWIIIAVAVIAAFGAALHLLENGLFDAEDADYDPIEDENNLYLNGAEYQITHNIESYLLIGTDDSGNVEAEGTKEYRGQMADFLLLFVMDRTDNTHGYLQINRNTMLDVPTMDTDGNGEGESFEQICTAHWYGGAPEHGCNNTVYCVSTLLGEMPIDGYYSIHMSQVGVLNQAVDGVEITLDEDFSDADPMMVKGRTLTLSDSQAEIYVRGRMQVGDGTNEARMQRQMRFMNQFKKQAREKMNHDNSFINDLFEELQDEAVTNIQRNRLSVITNQIYKGEDLGILTIDGETKIGTTLKDGQEHEEFYADEASIAEAMVKLCGIDEDHITYEDTGEDE
ncbi:MAG: LCP family protein [Firmicutes bacterium]|nr:LCP family protein [Bacillota bacterium]